MQIHDGTAGVTLIEAVVAIMVLGVAIPPLVALFNGIAKRDVEQNYQAVALGYADALLEEIVSKAFEDPDAASGSFGTEEGTRAAYDDVDDYDGVSNSPPQRLDGTLLDSYATLTRSVVVDNVTAAAPDPTTPAADGSTEFKRIAVTVAWTAAGGGEVTLSTLRTKLSGGSSTDPLDAVASAATADEAGNKKAELNLVSISSSDVVLASFALSADVSTEKIKKLKLDNKEIWKKNAGVNLPTGVLALNKGSTGDRTVDAGDDPVLKLEFKNNMDSEVNFTLVLNFTDGTSSTIAFTVDWN